MPKITTKKDLKKIINDNGFFVQSDSLEQLDRNQVEEILNAENANAIRTKAKLPTGDNILTFRGVVTQQFAPGETNRNGYKIDINGWDWNNYKLNPQILLQHDSNHPIGKALQIIKNETNIELIYFVNLDWVDGDANKARVAEGGFPAMSTGSLVKEYMFEHKKSGMRIDEDQYFQLDWEERKNYDFVVTKSEGIENSVVAIGSNPKALTVKDALEIFFNNNVMDKKQPENTTQTEEKENEDTEVTTEEEENNAENSEEAENADKDSDSTDDSQEDAETAENAEDAETEEEAEEEEAENADDSEDSTKEDSEEEAEKTESETKKDDNLSLKDLLPEEAFNAVQLIVNENARLVKENAEKETKLNELQKTLDNTPKKKVLISTQFQNNGIKPSGTKTGAKNGIECLKNIGVKVFGS